MIAIPFQLPPEPPRPSATEDDSAVINRWTDWANIALQHASLSLRLEQAATGAPSNGPSDLLMVSMALMAAHIRRDPTPSVPDLIAQARLLISGTQV